MNLLHVIEAQNLLLALMPPSGGENGDAPSPISILLPLVLTIGIMYFLLFRPQQKRMADHRKLLETLKKGDHVVTNGGIYGRIWAIEDKVVTLEVAKNVRIQVTRDSIQGRARADDPEGVGEEAKS